MAGKDAGIEVSEVKVTFYQSSDSCDPNECGQNLEITTDDAGGGPFVWIETKRWALGDDELDFLSQACKKVLELTKSRFWAVNARKERK
jgi:hypothetical protein